MSKGKPICTKCPKCRRGQYGYSRIEAGLVRTPNIEQRRKWTYGCRRGKVMQTMTNMTCLDCGHAWWTTLESNG